jgi:hypothetical protein
MYMLLTLRLMRCAKVKSKTYHVKDCLKAALRMRVCAYIAMQTSSLEARALQLYHQRRLALLTPMERRCLLL